MEWKAASIATATLSNIYFLVQGESNNGGNSLDSKGRAGITSQLCTFEEYTQANPAASAVPVAQAPIPVVAPSPGDDISPPNAITNIGKLNCVALHTAASAGWSTTAPREWITPSQFLYNIQVLDDGSVSVLLTVEYENHRAVTAGESMMVKFKVAKTTLCEGSELALVSTQFQDWNGTSWTDITADIAYTATAEAVVTAVLESNSGQTAGMAKSADGSFDATLGPIGARGRIQMKFLSKTSYSYDAMSTSPDGSDIGQTKLRPFTLQLPWAPLSNHQGRTKLGFSITTPAGSTILNPFANWPAYVYLKENLGDRKLLIIPELNSSKQLPEFQGSFDCLPYKPTTILLWLAVPNNIDSDWMLVNENADVPAAKPAHLTIYNPQSLTDGALLKVPSVTPGAPAANLVRIQLTTPSQVVRKQASVKPRLILNMNLSDSSGSTSCSFGSGKSVRSQLNMVSERRLWKRLKSIPALVKAGVLRPNDIYADVIYRFTHVLESKHVAMFAISDLKAELLPELASAIGNQFQLARVMSGLSKEQVAALSSIVTVVQALRTFQGTGGTDFVVPASGAASHLPELKAEARKLASIKTGADLPIKAFIDFDTDGGHNGSSSQAAEALRSLVDTAEVRNGVVTGFGSWVSQDCASRMAEVLGPLPAFLALTIPEEGQEGLDKIFRASFTAWVDALRAERLNVTLTAGAVPYEHVLLGPRNADGLEILAVKKVQGLRKPVFGPPDVQEVEFTGSVLKGISAGETVLLYAMCRLQSTESLAERLKVIITSEEEGSSQKAAADLSTIVAQEPLAGAWIGYDWLATLSGSSTKDITKNNSSAVPHLISRIEDILSFGFNLPSPSGSTSYLGRAKTDPNRASIDPSHQPEPPELFKAPAPVFYAFSVGAFQQQQMPSPNLGPATALLAGSPLRQSAPVMSSYALPQQSMSTSAFGFGAPSNAVGSAPPGGGGFGAFGASASRIPSGLFSSTSASPSPFGNPPSASFASRARIAAKPAVPSLFGYSGDEEPSTVPGYMNWTQLLQKTQNLCMGFVQNLNRPIEDELNTVRFAMQKLLRDPKVTYNCDGCNTSIKTGDPRFHCFDCEDYDECAACQGQHVVSKKLHRFVDVVSAQQSQRWLVNLPKSTSEDDGLMNELLGPAPTKFSPPSTSVSYAANCDGVSDWTVEINSAIVDRLLMAMLSWWPMFRAEFPKVPTLPAKLPAELVAEIKQFSVSYGIGVIDSTCQKVGELCGIASKVVDSIEREVIAAEK